MKVKFLQAGGYTNYQPLPLPPQAQVADPQAPQGQLQQQDGDGGYLEKSVLEKMLGKGITTDVMQYSQGLQQAYIQYQNMSDLQRNTYKGRQIRNMLKGDLGQLNALIRAKDTFDDAIKNAKSNDALDEVAVTGSGVIAKNNETGQVAELNYGQYVKQKDKYTLMTNAQLANAREYDPALTKNSNVFSVLNFAKGMTKIKQEVFDVVHNLGKSSTSKTNGEFTTNDPQAMQELQLAAQQGRFKIKNGESSSSNTAQLKLAQEVMWRNLSDASKAVLYARAAQEVDDPSKIESTAKDMATSLLAPEEEISHSVTYDESASKGGKGGGSGSEKMADYGINMNAYNLRDARPLSMIGPQGVKISGFASAIDTKTYTDKDNNRTILRNAGGLNNISYLSKAFTANGDKVLPDSTVITGDAYVTVLPVRENENGEMSIDEEGAKRYAQYQEAKAQMNHGNISAQQDSELRAKYGTAGLNLKKLIVAEASSYDTNSFFSDRDEGYYEKIKGSERDKLGEIVDPKHDLVHHAFWTQNDAHKHLVFIPAKGALNFGIEDGQKGRVPEFVYDVRGGYGGPDGSSSAAGVSIDKQTPQAMGLTTDYLKHKN